MPRLLSRLLVIAAVLAVVGCGSQSVGNSSLFNSLSGSGTAALGGGTPTPAPTQASTSTTATAATSRDAGGGMRDERG